MIPSRSSSGADAPPPRRRVLLRAGLAALVAGAAGSAAPPAAASGPTLTVSAAASLADALREIGRRFEGAHPGTTLRFNVAASGLLLQQLQQGAPADVFVSADLETMDRAVAAQLVAADTRRDIAANRLVLVTAAAGGPPLRALADLGQPAVRRIAIGKTATVPAGRYAMQALQAAGLDAALAPRLVPADNVRQVLDYVVRGEVEAGFVYRTDAAIAGDRVRIVLVVPTAAPIRYPAAVIAGSRHAAAARAFLDFAGGPVGRDVLARFGFEQP